jgi:hypothetical protein
VGGGRGIVVDKMDRPVKLKMFSAPIKIIRKDEDLRISAKGGLSIPPSLDGSQIIS